MNDIDIALRDTKPINLKDIIADIPKVLWTDIGGNKEKIAKIRQSIEWPLKNPQAFQRLGISPPNVKNECKKREFCSMVRQGAPKL